MEDKKRNEDIFKLANYYKSTSTPIHITLVSGTWLNGIILSVNKDFKDRLVLMEDKFGKMLVFFNRIIDDGIVPKAKENKNDTSKTP